MPFVRTLCASLLFLLSSPALSQEAEDQVVVQQEVIQEQQVKVEELNQNLEELLRLLEEREAPAPTPEPEKPESEE